MNIKNQSTESSDSFRNRVAVTNYSRPMSERWQNEHKNQIIEISYSSQTHWLYQIALHQCQSVLQNQSTESSDSFTNNIVVSSCSRY